MLIWKILGVFSRLEELTNKKEVFCKLPRLIMREPHYTNIVVKHENTKRILRQPIQCVLLAMAFNDMSMPMRMFIPAIDQRNSYKADLHLSFSLSVPIQKEATDIAENLRKVTALRCSD